MQMAIRILEILSSADQIKQRLAFRLMRGEVGHVQYSYSSTFRTFQTWKDAFSSIWETFSIFRGPLQQSGV